jgi:hypothetical protein
MIAKFINQLVQNDSYQYDIIFVDESDETYIINRITTIFNSYPINNDLEDRINMYLINWELDYQINSIII